MSTPFLMDTLPWWIHANMLQLTVERFQLFVVESVYALDGKPLCCQATVGEKRISAVGGERRDDGCEVFLHSLGHSVAPDMVLDSHHACLYSCILKFLDFLV